MNKLCLLAAAALLCPGLALAQVFPGVNDDKVDFSGSVSLTVGAQDNNPDSIYPPEGSLSHPSVVSRKLNTVLRVRKPGTFLGLFDGQLERRPYLEDSSQDRLNQLYGLFDYTDALKVRLGKQRVLWGHGFAYIPTDFINPPLDPTGVDLVKEGVVAVSFDYVRESYSLTGIAARSRRDPVTGLETGAGLGLKYATSKVSGLDLNLIYYHSDDIGHAAGVSLAADPSQLWFPRTSGLIFTGALAVHQKSRYPKVVDAVQATPGGPVPFPAVGPVREEGPYLSLLAGLSYDVPKWRLRMTGEYYYIGDAYSDSEYSKVVGALSDRSSLQAQLASPWLDRLVYGRNQRQYLSLTFGQSSITERGSRFSDTLGYEFGLLRGLGDSSNLFSVAVKSNYWDRAEIILRGFVPTGGAGTEFGTAPYDWYLQMEVRVGF